MTCRSFVVREGDISPQGRQILSLVRLPFRHPRTVSHITIFYHAALTRRIRNRWGRGPRLKWPEK